MTATYRCPGCGDWMMPGRCSTCKRESRTPPPAPVYIMPALLTAVELVDRVIERGGQYVFPLETYRANNIRTDANAALRRRDEPHRLTLMRQTRPDVAGVAYYRAVLVTDLKARRKGTTNG